MSYPNCSYPNLIVQLNRDLSGKKHGFVGILEDMGNQGACQLSETSLLFMEAFDEAANLLLEAR